MPAALASGQTGLRHSPHGASEEIRRIVHRWMTANSEGDSESALGRMSDTPGR